MKPHETRTLIERARSGDATARELLVERFQRDLECRVRSRLGSRVQESVSDVVQQVWLEALRSLERFDDRGDGSFRAWLGGIAENLIRNSSRREEVRARLQSDSLARNAAACDPEPGPERQLRREERLARLEDALRHLSPEHREVIILARIDGLKMRDIALRIERSEAAVKKLLNRALRALRRSFGDTESLGLPERRVSLDGIVTDGAEKDGDEP